MGGAAVIGETAEGEDEFSPTRYWRKRYRRGGISGDGSRGVLATYKAETLNRIIAEERIGSVMDFGCGDGVQIAMLDVPRLTGLDVSPDALEQCRAACADKAGWSFFRVDNREKWAGRRHDMALSLDVIYHLVEDEGFAAYMTDLFDHASMLVVIYSSDAAIPVPAKHVRHRPVSEWVERHRPDWCLRARLPNPHARAVGTPAMPGKTFAQFMIFEPALAEQMPSVARE